MRALDFFRQMVGPSLPGPLQNSFWTKLIPQMAHTESVVRHATIAISYLYEDIHHFRAPAIEKPWEKLALPHYDRAIRQAILLSQQGNLELIHICTILFSDIELLQGNPTGALLHSRHGAGIFKSLGSNDKLGIGSLGIVHSYQAFGRHLTRPHPTPEEVSSIPRVLLPAVGFTTLDQAYDSFASLVSKFWPLFPLFALGKVPSEQPSQTNNNVTVTPAILQRVERAVHLDLELWANCLLSSKDLFGLQVQETGYKFQSLKINWLAVKIWMTSSLWNAPANMHHGDGFQETVREYQLVWR
ncbi:C6 zinc finger domain protein [Penicillium malachiteum]|uniref:C6 zinc finger domain protein n=1 Tax=Penicillium malachiteum TaxID=1324776 RepID=A0AAD6MXN4_9EURO|nr:C6 zinc finger domain protein [Penicillium malachiteum]